MKTPLIRDFGQKFGHIFNAVRSSPRLLEILTEYHPGTPTKVTKKSIAYLLGQGDTALANWMESWAVKPGIAIDLAILLGFGPNKHEIAELTESAEDRLGRTIDHPQESYNIIDTWDTNSEICQCWHAFAGQGGQTVKLPNILPPRTVGRVRLGEIPEPRTKQSLRGLPMADFEIVFDAAANYLNFRMPPTLYGYAGMSSKDAQKQRLDQILRRTLYYPAIATGSPTDSTDPPQPPQFDVLYPATTSGTPSLSLVMPLQSGSRPYPDLMNAFRFDPPRTRPSQLALQQKSVLYGRFSGNYTIELSPLQYVDLNLTFARDATNQILRSLKSNENHFYAISLYGRPGQGKSIVLSQVVLDLCRQPGFFTFWAIDECDDPLDNFAHLSIDGFLSYFKEIGLWPRTVVFVIDSLSKRPNINSLFKFFADCEQKSNRYGVHIAFLFATDHRNCVFHDDNVITLELTERDEHRAFEKIAIERPALVQQSPYTLNEIFDHNPQIKRIYKNDVQSFVDFVQTCLAPTEISGRAIFADTRRDSTAARGVLEAFSVSELLDLPIPTRIALMLAANYAASEFSTIFDLKELSSKIALVDSEWEGVGLASPYHAQSLLRRSGLLTNQHVRTILSEILYHSLEAAKRDLARWLRTESEYTRHVIQRLTKRELCVYPELNKAKIVHLLMKEVGVDIFQALLRCNDPVVLARWAGTLSACSNFYNKRWKNHDPRVLSGFARNVYNLCETVVRLDREGFRTDSASAVSKLRAFRGLVRRYGANNDVRRLAGEAVSYIDLDALLRDRLKHGAVDVERRCNELIHAYIKFVADLPFDIIDREILQIDYQLAQSEALLSSHGGMTLDAGNWLERARTVRILGPVDFENIERKVQYLSNARAASSRHARDQATWRVNINRDIQQFLSEFPNCKERFQ